jgi:hypothetical protein
MPVISCCKVFDALAAHRTSRLHGVRDASSEARCVELFSEAMITYVDLVCTPPLYYSLHSRTRIYIYMCAHICIHTYVDIYIYIYIHTYIYTHTCMYAYVYSYIHIVAHTCMHMYTYIYAYSNANYSRETGIEIDDLK